MSWVKSLLLWKQLDSLKDRKTICISIAIGGYLWYRQFGKMCIHYLKGVPRRTVYGLLVLGHISFLWEGLAPWGKRLVEENGKVFNVYLFGEHVTVVDWDIYKQYLEKSEDAGELVPQWPPHLLAMLGEHSVLTLRAGRSSLCARHRLVKAKLMQALAPKQVLLMAQRMETAARSTLDAWVKQTNESGEVSMKSLIDRFAFENAVVSLLGDLADDHALLDDLYPLCETFVAGLVSVMAVDLPIFAYGRSMDARRKMRDLLKSLLSQAKTRDSSRNVLAQLTATSEEGRGLTEEEILDSLMTVLVAGILTTSYTIPHLIVNLWKEPTWKSRIAEESQGFVWTENSSIESPLSSTLKFVREAMRQRPAIDVFRRSKVDGPLDLGQYGHIPAGWPIATIFATDGYNMGETFDPDRWTPEASKQFVGFGGHTPHQCAGKNLALLEMQILLQVITGENYQIEVLDTSLQFDPIGIHYKGGLRAKVTRNAS